MGTKSEGLAKQFESKVQEAITTLEKLNEADWTKITDDEKWSVGVTAHHLAGAFESVPGAVKGLVAGQSLGLTMDKIDEMNARHAKEYANCTRAETVELFKKNAATAAATIKGLKDDQLARSGALGPGVPPMSAEQLITRALIYHIDGHMGSIRKTTGK